MATSTTAIGGVPDWITALIGGGLGAFAGYTPTQTSGSGTNTSYGSSDNSSWLTNLLNSLTSTLTDTNSASNTTGDTHGVTSSATNLGPQQQQLLSNLTSKYNSLQAPSLTGYAAQQTQGINKNADLASQAAQNSMASRGLSGSPLAGTTANNIDANRFSAISNMQSGLPVLQDQLNTQHLSAASNFMNTLPALLGQTTTSDTTNNSVTNTAGHQSQVQNVAQTNNAAGYQAGNTAGGGTSYNNSKTGGGLGSAAGGIASILASLFANKPIFNATTGGQSGGNLSGGLGGALGDMFSDERLKENIQYNPAKQAAERVLALRPSSWSWKDGVKVNVDKTNHKGFIAQDLMKVMPDLVHKDPKGSGYLKVDYAGLLSEIVGTLQHLNAKVEGVTI